MYNTSQSVGIIKGKFLKVRNVVYNIDYIETIQDRRDGTTEITVNGKEWILKVDYYTIIEILSKGK